MTIPNTPKPIYPNVPQTAGVPPLLRQPGGITSTIVLLASDAEILLRTLGIFQWQQWGLFNSSGLSAFTAAASGLAAIFTGSGQSVGDIEYQVSHRISTAPQEQGAFLSYNKVSTPFSGRITYIVSGTEGQRTQFLMQVQAAQDSIELFTLVMPEYSYPSCTITHHDFRRTSRNGVTMLSVDIWVEEVRVTGTAAYSTVTTSTGTTTAPTTATSIGAPGDTAEPSGAPQINGGTVQPQTPGSGQIPVIGVSGTYDNAGNYLPVQ